MKQQSQVAGFGGPNGLLLAGFDGPGLAGFQWYFFLFSGWFSWPSTFDKMIMAENIVNDLFAISIRYY